MQLKRNTLAATLSAVMLLASAGLAAAAPAVATINLNVRSGPGGGYPVVDVLQAGSRIDVGNCRSGWCYVDGWGARGWVSGQYLDARNPGFGGLPFGRPGDSNHHGNNWDHRDNHHNDHGNHYGNHGGHHNDHGKKPDHKKPCKHTGFLKVFCD